MIFLSIDNIYAHIERYILKASYGRFCLCDLEKV